MIDSLTHCGLRSVVCETDCLEGVSLDPDVEVFSEIEEFVLRPWCVRFSLVLRDANRWADHLAGREGCFGVC